MLKALAFLLLAIIITATVIALYEGLVLPLIQPFLKNKQKS